MPDRVVEPSSAYSSSDLRPPGRGGSGVMSALWRFTFTGSTLPPPEGAAVDDEAAARGERLGSIFGPAQRGSAFAGVFSRPLRSNRLVIAGQQSSSVTLSFTPINSETLGGGEDATYCLSDGKIAALRNVMYHWAWGFLIFVCTLLLLFGPAVHAIWMPNSTDRAFLVTTFVAAFALVVDIVIRCLVEKSYFSWNRCHSIDGRGKRNCRVGIFHVGSFLFWFDVVRTPSSKSPSPTPLFSFFMFSFPCPSMLQDFSHSGRIEDRVFTNG